MKAGGRSLTVLVLGGSGFIGRHAVAALRRRNCRIVVGSRDPERARSRGAPSLRSVDWRRARLEYLVEPDAWDGVLDGIDTVLNCVGILRPRGRATYERVHHLAPAALAAACRERGLRLVHVSALGLDPASRSRFLTSKLAGEEALRASGADWAIVRPSLLDGEGGYGAKWLRRVSRWPVHPLPADATGRIAALDVRDLGDALAAVAVRRPSISECSVDRDSAADRIYELGGPSGRTLAEHLHALRRMHTSRPALAVRVPGWLARAVSHVCDLLAITPFSFGHLELLRRDNCPGRNRLAELLGRPQRDVGLPPRDVGLPPPATSAPVAPPASRLSPCRRPPPPRETRA